MSIRRHPTNAARPGRRRFRARASRSPRGKRLGPMSERDEAPVAGQGGARLGRLTRHVPGRVVGRHPRPRPPGRQAAIGVSGPGHRAATTVAVDQIGRASSGVPAGPVSPSEARRRRPVDLLAVVEERGAPQPEQQHGRRGAIASRARPTCDSRVTGRGGRGWRARPPASHRGPSTSRNRRWPAPAALAFQGCSMYRKSKIRWRDEAYGRPGRVAREQLADAHPPRRRVQDGAKLGQQSTISGWPLS